MAPPEPLQHPDLDPDKVGVKNSHQLRRRASRVGKRSQNVEEGAHAELAPHRGGVFHCRVVRRRKHEADP